MLDQKYDSYGYKSNDKFYTTADLRKLKYPPVTRVPQVYTEVGSFISEAGQPMVDLVEPIIGDIGGGDSPQGDYVCFYGAYSGETMTPEIIEGSFARVTAHSVSFNPTIETEWGDYIWLAVPSTLSISQVESQSFDVTLSNTGIPSVMVIGELGEYNVYRSLNQLDKNTWHLMIS